MGTYATNQTVKTNKADDVVEPEEIDLDFSGSQPHQVAASSAAMTPIGGNPFESHSSLNDDVDNQD